MKKEPGGGGVFWVIMEILVIQSVFVASPCYTSLSVGEIMNSPNVT